MRSRVVIGIVGVEGDDTGIDVTLTNACHGFRDFLRLCCFLLLMMIRLASL